MKTEKPWQSTPTELLMYALEHLEDASDFSQRIGYLLLDVGVEKVLKTYLLLPGRAAGTAMGYEKRKVAADGNFHKLVEGVGKAAGSRLKGIDLSEIEYYHGIRNKVYHQGDGITIGSAKAPAYASLAVELLRRLLGVDLRSELSRPQKALEAQLRVAAIERRVGEVQQRVASKLAKVETALRLVIEEVAPQFLMPSFWLQLRSWQLELQREEIQIGLWRVRIDDPVILDSELQTEIERSMPHALREFAEVHRVRPRVVSWLADTHDDGEFLLLMADIAVGLPTDRSIETYASSRDFAHCSLESAVEHWLGVWQSDDPEEAVRIQGAKWVEDLEEVRSGLANLLGSEALKGMGGPGL